MTAGTNGHAPAATEIHARIAETRAQMTGTIGELQDRLRPQQLAQQAGDAVREAVGNRVKSAATSASQVGRRVAATTRSSARQLTAQAHDHPVVAAGVVAALVGLAAAMMARRRRGAPVAPLLPAVLAGAAGYYALSQVARRRPDAAARVTRAAGALGHDVTAAGQQVVQDARQWADDNPMVLGAAALVAGVIAGTALPVITVPPSWRPRVTR